jgi:heat shock protein HslJ
MNLRLLTLLASLAVAGLILGCHPAPVPGITWSLTGTVWKLVQLNGQMFGQEELPTLVLEASGSQANGFGGVNHFSGSYKLEGDTISFGPLAATKMAGPPDKMKLEDDFLKALSRATMWKIHGPWLTLSAGETDVARFQALPAGTKEF